MSGVGTCAWQHFLMFVITIFDVSFKFRLITSLGQTWTLLFFSLFFCLFWSAIFVSYHVFFSLVSLFLPSRLYFLFFLFSSFQSFFSISSSFFLSLSLSLFLNSSVLVSLFHSFSYFYSVSLSLSLSLFYYRSHSSFYILFSQYLLYFPFSDYFYNLCLSKLSHSLSAF